MNHIVQFSGGKDSTCMLLMMLERGMQIDDIIFCDTGMEFPAMYEHIAQVRQYIKPYGKDITILKAEHSFEWYMNEKPRKDGGKGWGWSSMFNRWCTKALKTSVQKEYCKTKEPYISYIGIAYDEPKRHLNIADNVRHPLYEWKITEAQALSFCYAHKFYGGGIYKDFKRVSCWCCPLKSLEELRVLYSKYPELWQRLKDMDSRAFNSFKADYSVLDLEKRFKAEEEKKARLISLF